MKIECTVEELLKIVLVKQTDTIKIEEPLLQAKVIEKLNQAKNQ